METVLMAADTGHLVFSTLHTTDAAMTMQRVLSFFPPHQQEATRHQLAANLQAVVSQRLVQRRGGSGRVPAVEILINTPTIREMLQTGKSFEGLRSIIEEGVTNYGMQILRPVAHAPAPRRRHRRGRGAAPLHEPERVPAAPEGHQRELRPHVVRGRAAARRGPALGLRRADRSAPARRRTRGRRP
jgi:hypothetical protein